MGSVKQSTESDAAPPHKRACTICARRKVKCDKGDPCSNCRNSKVRCTYDASSAPYRPRKRAADDELVVRLSQYEALMRKHGIDYSDYMYSNLWVPGGTGVDVETKEKSPVTLASAGSATPAAASALLKVCSWSNLRHELQFPPTQVLRHRDDPLFHSTPSLNSILTTSQPTIHELQPEPKLVFRLWQRYSDSVDPLIKFAHTPTLQQRVMAACWDPTGVPIADTAALLSVCTLAVTSMSSADCDTELEEPRAGLLTRYRTAALRAFVAAEILVTKDFAVLQALVLFIFADPESSQSLSLIAIAIKIAHSIGIHLPNSDPKLSVFDSEMRLRLWWQLRGLEIRANLSTVPLRQHQNYHCGDMRLPLNVNDADLHPGMELLPIEHTGPTEMLYPLVKFQLPHWIRSSIQGDELSRIMRFGPVRDKSSLHVADEAIENLGDIFKTKYLDKLDCRIPLHKAAMCTATGALNSMRFRFHHPRGPGPTDGGKLHLSQAEMDTLFESALTSLEMKSFCLQTGFSPHIIQHMSSRFEVDSYVYVISDLRQRLSGDRVEVAWGLIEELYNEHPELVSDSDSIFNVSLGGLTLEAWKMRREALLSLAPLQLSIPTPQFIQQLQSMKDLRGNSEANLAAPDSFGIDGPGSMDNEIDWNYWNMFLQL